MKKSVISILLLAILLLLPNEGHTQEFAKAKVIELTGEVRFKNPGDADWQAVSKDMELLEGASLFVGPDSDCQLAFGDDFKSVTRIKQDSRIVLKSISTQPQIELSAGEVFALVRNLKKESSFRVSTPTAVATVRGTAFSFAAEGIGSEVSSTVQVYESIVGLNPIDQPNKEMPIEEGRGATMGPDGTMEKQFELSPEDMQAGKDFMSAALDVMALEKPEAVEAPEAKSDDDDKEASGPNPPGPDSGDPSDAQVDSAVDGVVMDMASDSEFSKSETFGGSSMNRMFEHLADLNGDGMETRGLPGEGLGRMDPAMYGDMVKNAIEQTDYFQNMPPDVQARMMEAVDGRMENGGFMGGPDGGFSLNGQPLFMPEGGPNTGGEPFFGTMMDPSMMGPGPMDTFFDPNELASFVNDPSLIPPYQPQSFIDFINAIRNDYIQYGINNSGNYSGYTGPQTISNFNFVRDDQSVVGSITYTPLPGLHTHTDGTFLHLQSGSVVVKDSTNAVVLAPPGPVEVKTT